MYKADRKTTERHALCMAHNRLVAFPNSTRHDIADYAAEVTSKFVRAHGARDVDASPGVWYDYVHANY